MPQRRKAAIEATCVDMGETAVSADLSLHLSSPGLHLSPEEPEGIAGQPGQANRSAAQSTHEDVAQQQKGAALPESVPITCPLIHMNPLLLKPLHSPSHQVASSPELPFSGPCSRLLQHATATPLTAAQPAQAASGCTQFDQTQQDATLAAQMQVDEHPGWFHNLQVSFSRSSTLDGYSICGTCNKM